MVSEKQLIANLQNAKASTGPVTIEGKEIVAANAIKHGIFTKDLILASGAGQESQEEYDALLTNLIQCLSPRNQMESLLVEKIAVDFWRLRRTIRFEAGSIHKHIEYLISSSCHNGRTDSAFIERQIEHAQGQIAWNTAYLECLKRNEVTFEKPVWEGKGITSDIAADFLLIARALPDLTRIERNQLSEREWSFGELEALIARHGYSQDGQITTRLIELYSGESERLSQQIEELRQKKIHNQAEDSRNAMIGSLPSDDGAEKAMKYERSIQKSIFQNLFLLKKLQGLF